MSNVRKIEFIDEDGKIRGSVENPEAVQLLIEHSDLIKLRRNSDIFSNSIKINDKGILQFPISKSVISDETLEDLVDFLNGKPIYKYNNTEEILFKNKIMKYENYNTERDFDHDIYQALTYFILPDEIINQLYSTRVIYPQLGEYENMIENAMNERRQYDVRKKFIQEKNRLGQLNNNNNNQYSKYLYNLRINPLYQLPKYTEEMTNTEYERWLRSGGIQNLRNYQNNIEYNREEQNRYNRYNNYNRYNRYNIFRGGGGGRGGGRGGGGGGKTRKRKQRRQITYRKLR
jgi:hypothetical protein